MSVMVIVLEDDNVEIGVLGELHKLLGGSLIELRNAIRDRRPVVEMEIFDNQYDEKAGQLRKLIALLRDSELKAEVYELPEGDAFATSQSLAVSRISLDILENTLDAADEEIDCLQR